MRKESTMTDSIDQPAAANPAPQPRRHASAPPTTPTGPTRSSPLATSVAASPTHQEV